MADPYPHKQPAGTIWVAEAIDWTGNAASDHLKIGFTPQSIKDRAERGQRTKIGQMYGVVGTGMIMAEHVFKGLRRGMLVGDDSSADKKKLAVTWSATRDAVFTGPAEDGECPAPL